MEIYEMSEVTTETMSPEIKEKSKFTTKDLAFTALFAVIIAVCSWISIPTTIPFTMQTFAVFCALGILGGKRGSAAVLVYIALGAVGLPVFAGFSGGFGVILGTTGGYIVGFLCSAVVYWVITAIFGNKLPVMIIAMVLGLFVCYAFGTAWYMIVYAKNTGDIGLLTALGRCVFPYIIPDLIKMALAILITKRLAKHVSI